MCSAQTGQRDLTVAGPARRALVIGNDAYQHVSPLRNAVNDARDLTAKLETLGFETVVATDVDLRAMEQAIDGFISSIRPGDVALFHFSGHERVTPRPTPPLPAARTSPVGHFGLGRGSLRRDF